jgi:ribonuclease P protein component
VNARVRLRFQPGSRLLRPADFTRAYSAGRRLNNEFFTANVIANSLQHPRLGLSVAARMIKTAVGRNRVKRQVRDSFRKMQHALPAVDCVIGVRSGTGAATAAQLRESLTQLWSRVTC